VENIPKDFWILWKQVVKKGKHQEKGLTHKLTDDQIATILATAGALGVNKNFLSQLAWDLKVARYKLWDEIGMLLTGRYKGYGETPEEEKNAEKFVRILALLYATKSIPEMIEDLRANDYTYEDTYNQLIERSRKLLGEII